MKSYFTLFKYLAFIAVAVLATACDSYTSPVGAKKASTIVKTETKWKCDAATEAKTFMTHYKEYDKSGNLIKSIEYSGQGSVDVETSYTYVDDESYEEKTYYNNSGVADSTVKSSYKLDDAGRVVQKVSFGIDGDTLSILRYTYDNQGNITARVELSSSGSVISKTSYTYTYNQQGEIIERLTNPGTNGDYQSRDTIIYQVSEKKVERFNYNSEGAIETRFAYYYNPAGKLVKEVEKNSKGEIVNIFIYEYVYY